jgi:hypothetical protein
MAIADRFSQKSITRMAIALHTSFIVIGFHSLTKLTPTDDRNISIFTAAGSLP